MDVSLKLPAADTTGNCHFPVPYAKPPLPAHSSSFYNWNTRIKPHFAVAPAIHRMGEHRQE